MNKIRHFFLHNAEPLLYGTCWLCHALFAPLTKAYGYDTLLVYNVSVSFVYATFVLLFKNIRGNMLFFTFFYFDLLVYSVLLTFQTNADFGSTCLTVCSVPLLFLATITNRKYKKYYIVLISLALIATVCALGGAYKPTRLHTPLLDNDAEKMLYLAHSVVITCVMTLFLFYYSLLSEIHIVRSRKKAIMQAEALDFKANHDQLTGLMNRRKINVYLHQAQARRDRDGTDYALTIFDIDSFKKINDTYGHDAGDFILQQLSATVASLLHDGQQFARWGGEEFVIFFPAYSSEIVSQLNAIRTQVASQVFSFHTTDIHITLTFGLSSTKSCSELEKLIIDADDRLMYGKQHGKNQVVCAPEFL